MSQCHSITKQGQRCRRAAIPGRRYCWQHEARLFRNVSIGGLLVALLALIGLAADLYSFGFSMPGFEPTTIAQLEEKQSLEADPSVTVSALAETEIMPTTIPNNQNLDTVGSSCREFYYVFLVDQSNSMSGSEDSYGTSSGPTDPLGSRYYSLLVAIDMMSDIALDLLPGSTFHISVVYFGTLLETVLPWTRIGPYHADGAEKAFAERSKIKENIPSATNMGETLFLAPLREARYLLESIDRYQENCPELAIILLTDGRPNTNDIQSFNWENHMHEVTNFALDDLRPMGVTIYVLGIRNDGQWADMSKYWKDVTFDRGYTIHLSNNRADIALALREILQETALAE